MNDPNGLVYFEGEYHLFYQYYPDALVWGPMHWGHAVSTDLLHWQHLDIALTPDKERMCFSGSAIVDWHDTTGLFGGKPGLLAYYTAHCEPPPGAPFHIQDQRLAYSLDKGRTWQDYANNPVVPSAGLKDFRDPKVFWHAPTQRWVMALACDTVLHFYTSPNLLEWQLASVFGEGQGAHTDGPWECPDLFELPIEGTDETRWVLVVGIGPGKDSKGSCTQYFIGRFDGERFINDNPGETVLWMDHGRDFYAAQSWSDVADGRRLAIAWNSNWLYANQVPEAGWRSAMTLPRELSLYSCADGVRLKQAFVRELEASGQGMNKVLAAARTVKAGDVFTVAEAQGPQHGRLVLRLEPGSQAELFLQQDSYADLCISRGEDGLTVTQQRQGKIGVEKFDTFYPQQLELTLPDQAQLDVEWVVDHGSLEILLNGGRVSLSNVSISDCTRQAMSISVTQGNITLENIEYRLI